MIRSSGWPWRTSAGSSRYAGTIQSVVGSRASALPTTLASCPLTGLKVPIRPCRWSVVALASNARLSIIQRSPSTVRSRSRPGCAPSTSLPAGSRALSRVTAANSARTRIAMRGGRGRCYSAAVRLIGAGRDAELFDLGGGRVLRRPRRPRPMDAEAAFMGRVRAAGYPAPEVFEVRPDGLVMERLEGPTMLDDLAAHPWRVGRHARTLAELHVRLHRIAAEDGLPGPFGAPVAGDVLVHGDLHPDNVVLASSG